MPVKRLGVATPSAFDGITYTELATVDVVSVASVIAANKGNVTALVTIFVEPFDALGFEAARSYIVKDLEIEPGQSFETFRVAVAVGDKIFVGSSTSDVNFNSTAAYEQVGRTTVAYQATQPDFPVVGDIWISSEDDSVNLYTGTGFSTVSTVAPVGPTGPEGPQGVSGPQGPTGPEGFGVKVNGTYATLELLQADFPQGEIGDGYLIGQNLYVWSELNGEWTDAGLFVGETGPTGEVGATGPTGATGDADVYTPEEVLNWNDPAPTTIGEALDELASRLTALEP